LLISILLPSRGRPDQLARLIQSAHDTADNFEFVIRLDEDDPTLSQYRHLEDGMVRIFTGARDVLSKYWNECYDQSHGDILMHCGDDIIFRTGGWDEKVQQAFDEEADPYWFVHGDDGYWGHNFGTHGFLHREWAETVGYFVPPYFSSDYNDTWLNDVANQIHRRKYVDILTEHMHPNFGKGPLDQTHIDRLERHRSDNVDQLYAGMATQRQQDAQLLTKAIEASKLAPS
jgi:hypothetical protein